MEHEPERQQPINGDAGGKQAGSLYKYAVPGSQPCTDSLCPIPHRILSSCFILALFLVSLSRYQLLQDCFSNPPA